MYGEVIGCATTDLAAGEWFHTCNVRDSDKRPGADGAPSPGQEEGQAWASLDEDS